MTTTNYVKQGIFQGPDNIIGPNNDWAIVFGSDATLKLVRQPFGGAQQLEALALSSVGVVTFGTQAVFASGASFTGGQTIAGGLVIASGGETIAGGLTLLDATLTLFESPGGTTAALAITTAGTIPAAAMVQRVSSTGAIPSAALAAGTAHGQVLWVVNNGTNVFTFAASATSRVASGTTKTVAATAAQLFVWDNVATLWFAII